MTFQSRRGFAGLVTAVAETMAPEGALRLADNVVVRRDGMLEPRQGFEPLAGQAGTLRAAHAFGASAVYEGTEGLVDAAGNAFVYKPVSTAPGAALVRMRADSYASAAARGNLYLPMADAVVKLSSAADTAYRSAGLASWLVPLPTSTLVAGSTLPSGQWVGYRVVVTSTDPNGLVLRSAPTDVLSVSNASGSTKSVQLTLSVLDAALTGALEIYRTRMFPTTITLDDEMQLVGTVTLSGAASYTFTDTTADSARGATLYTSPSRNGIEGRNDPPPPCGAIALYKSSLFFGNVQQGTSRLVVSFNTPVEVVASTSPIALTGLGSYRINANGAIVTSATSPSGRPEIRLPGYSSVGQPVVPVGSVVPGMRVRDVASTWPPGGAVALVTRVVPDGSELDSVDYAAEPPDQTNTGGIYFVFEDVLEINGALVALTPMATFPARVLAATSGRVLARKQPTALPGYTETWAFESTGRGAQGVAVRAGRGGATLYSPALPNLPVTQTMPFSSPLTLSATPAALQGTAAVKAQPATIYWSTPDEPEHVPPKNYALVGEAGKAILALAPTRDALFILKEDGVFRLSGTNGTFRIDPFDPTTFCVSPSSVRTLNNQIFMLANKGLVSLDDAGVKVVSAPLRHELLTVVDTLREAQRTTGLYRYDASTGVVSAVDDRTNEYVVLVPGTLGIGGDALVYNTDTNAFTTWTFSAGPSSFVGEPAGLGTDAQGKLVLLYQGGVMRSRAAVSVAVGASSFLITGDALSTGTVTGSAALLGPGSYNYTFNVAQDIAVGDLVVGTVAARVVTKTSGTLVGLDRDPGASVRVLRPFVCTVEPQGFSGPNEAGKLWTHAVWAFTRLEGPHLLQARFVSAGPLVAPSAQVTRETIELQGTLGAAAYAAGTLLRANVPVQHRRAWLLRPGVEIQVALGTFALEQIAADATSDAPQRVQSHGAGAA